MLNTELTTNEASEAVMSRSIDAFNARDLEAMLACMSEGVLYRPLPRTGVCSSYRGHDGVAAYIDELEHLARRHSFELLETRDAGHGLVLAVGNVRETPTGDPDPFCALHQFSNGLIISVHHYLGEADTLPHVGLLGE